MPSPDLASSSPVALESLSTVSPWANWAHIPVRTSKGLARFFRAYGRRDARTLIHVHASRVSPPTPHATWLVKHSHTNFVNLIACANRCREARLVADLPRLRR